MTDVTSTTPMSQRLTNDHAPTIPTLAANGAICIRVNAYAQPRRALPGPPEQAEPLLDDFLAAADEPRELRGVAVLGERRL